MTPHLSLIYFFSKFPITKATKYDGKAIFYENSYVVVF